MISNDLFDRRMENYEIDNSSLKENDTQFKRKFNLFLALIIGITTFWTVVEIIINLLVAKILLLELLHIYEFNNCDYIIVYDFMKKDLSQFYNQKSIYNTVPIYLYYWYFIFYPMTFIPLEIGIYLWDIFRFVITIYVGKNIHKITKDIRDIKYFYIFCAIGYAGDMLVNNNNWIVLLLLFLSYTQLEKDRKIISGFLFTLSLYKVLSIVYLFALIITKKINRKNIHYFLGPLLIACIPYIIFPSYFLQMYYNWLYIDDNIVLAQLKERRSIYIQIYLNLWQLVQHAHLMFESIVIIIFISNLQNEDRKEFWQNLIYLSILILIFAIPFSYIFLFL